MIRGVIAAAVLLGSFTLAQAGPACFRPNEIEAEQAVRFQNELMVLSETCNDGIYGGFVERNVDAIRGYQRAMIEHFRRTSRGHAETNFDRYQTHLANEAAIRHGGEPVASLCSQSAAFLQTARTLQADGFRKYVAQQAAQSTASYRRCRS
jgi:hypothetical protein